jgi:translation initiation factor IF-2
MNKRVHEIAKERGLPAKDVLARLKAAGIDVKASSSSVDEEVASRVLANGGAAASAPKAAPKKAAAKTAPAPAPTAVAAAEPTAPAPEPT